MTTLDTLMNESISFQGELNGTVLKPTLEYCTVIKPRRKSSECRMDGLIEEMDFGEASQLIEEMVDMLCVAYRIPNSRQTYNQCSTNAYCGPRVHKHTV